MLGAATIAPGALLKPAHRTGRVEVVSVAARDVERARSFAKKHKIPRVAASYEDLLADPELDAIYNPLPNGLHGHWTIASLDAGKHVLCEKPFTANADEARHVAEAAASHPGLVVMEAFHYEYHPLTAAPRGDRAVRRARHHQADRDRLRRPDGQTGRHPLPARSGRWGHDGHGLLPDFTVAPAGRGARGSPAPRPSCPPRRRPRHGCAILPPRGRHGPRAMLHVLVVGAPHARRSGR